MMLFSLEKRRQRQNLLTGSPHLKERGNAETEPDSSELHSDKTRDSRHNLPQGEVILDMKEKISHGQTRASCPERLQHPCPWRLQNSSGQVPKHPAVDAT